MPSMPFVIACYYGQHAAQGKVIARTYWPTVHVTSNVLLPQTLSSFMGCQDLRASPCAVRDLLGSYRLGKLMMRIWRRSHKGQTTKSTKADESKHCLTSRACDNGSVLVPLELPCCNDFGSRGFRVLTDTSTKYHGFLSNTRFAQPRHCICIPVLAQSTRTRCTTTPTKSLGLVSSGLCPLPSFGRYVSISEM